MPHRWNDADAQKQAAAEAAVREVQGGMLVGLGTGTTAAHAISALARRVGEGLAIRAVATSKRTAQAARSSGIDVIDFASIDEVDLVIDGVDEIDPQFRAIKGGGGAMLREKIVAQAGRRMIAIADASKSAARLGQRPVPIEVLPFACSFVLRRSREMGCQAVLRHANRAPFRTDQDNLVIDCAFGAIDDPAQVAQALSSIPGVLGHGLFLREIGSLYLGTTTGVERRDRANYL